MRGLLERMLMAAGMMLNCFAKKRSPATCAWCGEVAPRSRLADSVRCVGGYLPGRPRPQSKGPANVRPGRALLPSLRTAAPTPAPDALPGDQEIHNLFLLHRIILTGDLVPEVRMPGRHRRRLDLRAQRLLQPSRHPHHTQNPAIGAQEPA